MTIHEYVPIMLRAAVFDIETMNFYSGGVRDHMVCCCILPLDNDDIEEHALSFSDKGEDQRVLKETLKALSAFDILIGHNAHAFDAGWLASRLAYHSLSAPVHRWLIYDTYQAAKRMGIKSGRKSLAFLCDYFRLKFVKTGVYPVKWANIDSRKKVEFEEALREILEHCREDVMANRQLFYALWPLDKSMVNLPVLKKL